MTGHLEFPERPPPEPGLVCAVLMCAQVSCTEIRSKFCVYSLRPTGPVRAEFQSRCKFVPRLKAKWLRLQTAASHARRKQEAGWKVTLPLSPFIMVPWHWRWECPHKVRLDWSGKLFGCKLISYMLGSHFAGSCGSPTPPSDFLLLVGDEHAASFATSPPRLLRVCFVSAASLREFFKGAGPPLPES